MCLQGLSWVVTRQVLLCTDPPESVYGEALTGFSHIFNPDGLNTLLSSRPCPWKAPTVGTLGGVYIPRTDMS